MIEEKVPYESTRPPQLIEKLKQQELQDEKKLNWKEIFKEIFILLFVIFGVVMPFRMYVAEPYLVDGTSMDPTFKTGNYLIVDKISDGARKPERNTVLVFKYPNNPSKNFIKRVIGLPGETVVVKGDTVTIINKENPKGFNLDQSYIVHKYTQDVVKTLGETEYFVMGDNRKDSFDSRYWGALDEKYILGRPVIQLLPFRDIKIMPGKVK
ncbi:MAG TPA: signal peptidase I [Parcubacteria group bacterium]|jgi:signal peptidase I|nr:signal peptidase I [Parcubacteria group bacterium]